MRRKRRREREGEGAEETVCLRQVERKEKNKKWREAYSVIQSDSSKSKLYYGVGQRNRSHKVEVCSSGQRVALQGGGCCARGSQKTQLLKFNGCPI